jgi:hypothetical protein
MWRGIYKPPDRRFAKMSPSNIQVTAVGKNQDYRRCFETSLVISNMLTWLLPLNTGLSESSALIMVRFFLSWQPFLLMYFQSFLVSSERGSGSDPTMAASLSSGWTGLMKAGFSLRLAVFLLVFGMEAD